MRTLIAVALVLAAVSAFSMPAEAESVGVGKCEMSGACVGVCVDVTTGCHDGHLVCVGASYQVPQCAGKPLN